MSGAQRRVPGGGSAHSWHKFLLDSRERIDRWNLQLAPGAVPGVLAGSVAVRQNPQRLAHLDQPRDGARGKGARHQLEPAEDLYDAQGHQTLRARR